MISTKFQWIAIAGMLIYFVVLVVLLKKRKLSLKYTLLWFLSGLVLLVLALFPKLLDAFANLIGIYSATNALFLVLFFCLFILMISITSIVSHQRQNIVRLVQQVALLEERVRRLEDHHES